MGQQYKRCDPVLPLFSLVCKMLASISHTNGSYFRLCNQLAIACPISSGESSCKLWNPGTITILCAGQVLQNSCWPACSLPGSPLISSLGTELGESQSP